MVEKQCVLCNVPMYFKGFWDATQENAAQFAMYLFQCPKCKEIGIAFAPEDTE